MYRPILTRTTTAKIKVQNQYSGIQRLFLKFLGNSDYIFCHQLHCACTSVKPDFEGCSSIYSIYNKRIGSDLI